MERKAMFDIFGSVSMIYLINIAMAVVVIFLERKDPTATLAWVLVLLIFPGLGFIFYLLLSQNFSRKKLFTMKIYAKKNIWELYQCSAKAF